MQDGENLLEVKKNLGRMSRKHEFGSTKIRKQKFLQEILKSFPQYQKVHQNMLITPSQCWTRICNPDSTSGQVLLLVLAYYHWCSSRIQMPIVFMKVSVASTVICVDKVLSISIHKLSDADYSW